MEINIINAPALRLAQAATNPKDTVPLFRCIRILPDGSISGTNSFTLAHHPSGAAEPFEGKPIFITPQRTIPTNATDIVLDLKREQMRYRQGSKPGVMSLEVHGDISFPYLDGIIDFEPRDMTFSGIGINAVQLATYAKAHGDGPTISGDLVVTNRGKVIMLRLLVGTPNQIVLLPPLRESGISL